MRYLSGMGKGRKVNWQMVFKGQRFQFDMMGKRGHLVILVSTCQHIRKSSFWQPEWIKALSSKPEASVGRKTSTVLTSEGIVSSEAAEFKGLMKPELSSCCAAPSCWVHPSPGRGSSRAVGSYLGMHLSPSAIAIVGGSTDWLMYNSSPFRPLTRVCWAPTICLCIQHCSVWHMDQRSPSRTHSLTEEEGEYRRRQGNVRWCNQMLKCWENGLNYKLEEGGLWATFLFSIFFCILKVFHYV